MEKEVEYPLRGPVYLGADAMACASGVGTEAVLESIEAGRVSLSGDNPFGVTAGAIDSRMWSGLLVEGYTRLESLFIWAIGSVLKQTGLSLRSPDVRLIVSTTKGNIDLLAADGVVDERVFLSGLGRRVAGYFGAAVEPTVISNACISGLTAAIVGARFIRWGRCRHAVVAGGDLLSRFVTEGFAAFRSLSDGPCRPYDAGRGGLSLGEACGALVLTADRRYAQRPAVCFEGGAVTNDANHISGPSRNGVGLYEAIGAALGEAGVGAEGIDAVNMHGTATVYNDRMEVRALEAAGLVGCPVSGLKGYFGHTLGACGVVETILTAWQMRRGVVYGTAGFRTPDPEATANVSAAHRRMPVRRAVKTASGFGGCNAAAVLSLEEYSGLSVGPCGPAAEAVVTASYAFPRAGRPFAEQVRAVFKRLGLSDQKFFKMDDLSKLAYVSVESLLRGSGLGERYKPQEIAVVLANRASSLDTDIRHRRLLDERPDEGASPAVFVYTLPNVSVGEVCIRRGIRGENTFFIRDRPDGFAESYAADLIRSGAARAAVCGWCDLLADEYSCELKLLECGPRA